MSARLKVIKADGSIEDYLYTKVLGSVNNALALTDQANIFAAEQFTEAITYFLYQRRDCTRVTSSEILSMIQIVLEATFYKDAAIALVECYYQRQIKRHRIEVIDINMQDLNSISTSSPPAGQVGSSRWDKSRIVRYLTTKHNLAVQTARMIASMVEEKVLNMGINRISCSLVKQIVLADAAAVLRAEEQLKAAIENSKYSENRAEMEVCLRQ